MSECQVIFLAALGIVVVFSVLAILFWGCSDSTRNGC